MGKPAARLTDSTSHGGVIAGPGCPTVMIGKMPAATLLDQHICPMCTGPVPHVGGPITLGSTGVFLGKKPSARISDVTVCVGPPSMPVVGCFTVLVGEVGAGSAGASAGAAASAQAAAGKGPKAIEAFPILEAPPAPPVTHEVRFVFQDSAGQPLAGVPYVLKDPLQAKATGVSPDGGEIVCSGYAKAGSFEVTVRLISEVKWSKAEFVSNEDLDYEITGDGFEDGDPVEVVILGLEEQGQGVVVESHSGKLSGGKLKGTWHAAKALHPEEAEVEDEKKKEDTDSGSSASAVAAQRLKSIEKFIVMAIAGGQVALSPSAKATKPVPPPAPTLTGKFLKTHCKCGDSVGLDLVGENLPGGTKTKVTFRALKEGAALETITGILGTKLHWIAQKTGKEWGKAETYFIAKASEVKAKSENHLTLEKYADIARETKTLPCVSGVFGWTGKFDIEFKNGEIIIETKIKLINRLGAKPDPGVALPAAGPAVTDQDKNAIKADVESKLSRKWVMHRKECKRAAACNCDKSVGCCKFEVKVKVTFVEAGEHHVVNLFQGPGRANASNWTRVKTRDNSWAHETGHLLGWYDEYVGGAVGTAPRWKAPNPTAVMSSGLVIPFEYYWDFRDWLKTKTGEDWNGIA